MLLLWSTIVLSALIHTVAIAAWTKMDDYSGPKDLFCMLYIILPPVIAVSFSICLGVKYVFFELFF
jgi:hypothetical protein